MTPDFLRMPPADALWLLHLIPEQTLEPRKDDVRSVSHAVRADHT